MTVAATLLSHALYLLTIAVLLVGGSVLGIVWCKNVFRAGSKLVAALCGCSGFNTFSAECGARSGNSVTWDGARKVIDLVLEEGHCVGAAKREGLL